MNCQLVGARARRPPPLILKKGVEALFEQTLKEGQAEQDAYDAATSEGANQSKQREWTATIRERLKKAGIAY